MPSLDSWINRNHTPTHSAGVALHLGGVHFPPVDATARDGSSAVDSNEQSPSCLVKGTLRPNRLGALGEQGIVGIDDAFQCQSS